MYDVAIVGAGFSGSVLAERFASAGRKVVVVDQRSHIAGNAHDYYDRNGIMIHAYGAHIFHTNDANVFNYLSKFTEWREYTHRALSYVDGQLLPIPINRKTLEMLYGPDAVKDGALKFLDSVRVRIDNPKNAEENVISRVGQDLYEKFFKGYTEKQWGRPATQLRPSVTARIPVRDDYDDRYFTDKYQAMPLHGYTEMFRKILDHPNITLKLQKNWKDISSDLDYKKLIYTGPVDEYFDHCYGKLEYRSLRFKFKLHHEEYVQPVAGIKYPNDHDYTRTIEFKHLTGQEHPYTVTSEEYPESEGDPYYPIPADDTEELYSRYREDATKLNDVRFVGRLGTYRYYNMDQCVAAALHEFKYLTGKGW